MAVGASSIRADFGSGEVTYEPESASEESPRSAVEGAGYRVADVADAPERSSGPVHRRGPQPRRDYDLVILGSGSASFAAGIRAKDLGATVALCEANTIGGTCVNIGCVPSKAMLAAADLYPKAGHSPFSGAATSSGVLDLSALVEAKDRLVDELRRDKYENLAEEYGSTLLCGHGEFTGPDTFSCDGERIEADQYLIATGASPSAPPIPGLDEAGYLTSTTVLELRKLPESLVVIGANAIGLEMGQLFLHLGSRVTFLEALPRIAPFEEPEVSEVLAQVLTEEGGEVYAGAKVTRVERDGPHRVVIFEYAGSERRVACDQVLVATGRRPNTRGIGLEAAGVALTERGAVQVNEFSQTTNARIWAAGDVTASPQFVYVTASQGSPAADNAIGGAGRSLDLKAMPRVTFTTPQVASVGMTEEDAERSGLRVNSRVLGLNAVPRALVNRETRGLFKVVAEEGSDRIVGVHILAENAGDVILAGVYAVKKDMTVADLAEMWTPYLAMGRG